jgi:hypothetical protein
LTNTTMSSRNSGTDDDARGGRSGRQGQRLPSSLSSSRRPFAPQQRRGRGSGGGPGSSAPAAVSLESFAQRKGHIRALEEFKKRKQTHRMETAKALRRYRKVMKQEGMEAGTGASRKRQRQPGQEADENKDGIGEDQPKDHDVARNGVDKGVKAGVESRERVSQQPAKKQRKAVEENNTSLAVENNHASRRGVGGGACNDSNNEDDDNYDIKEGESENEEMKLTARRKKQTKSNPLQKAVEKAKDTKAKAEEARLAREAQEKLRKQKLRARKQQSKLLQKRTKKGQPIIKHMVDNLLQKLEKQQQQG